MATFFTMNADIMDFVGGGTLLGKASMRVHFTMNVRAGDFVVTTTGSRPSLIDVSKTITGYIRSDGRMYNSPPVSAAPFDLTDDGTLGVRLLASTADLNVSGGVTYRVAFEQVINGVNIEYRSFVTSVVPSTDTTVNLATYCPVPRSGGFT